MPSFDIVSQVDKAEIDNALAGLGREVAQRFDFKDSKCRAERKDDVITVLADDDLKLKQMHELLKVHFTRRKVDSQVLDFKAVEKAAGNAVRQEIAIRQGIDQDLAKKLVRAVKDSRLKVQASIQGDTLRVSGGKRDDLQQVITLVRNLPTDRPLQYINFRD